MTPTHAETPLRKSEIGAIRTPAETPVINDDDAERREARRRTVFEDSLNSSTVLEENETLKNCLKIFQENKLSKENAWSLSVIDTLSHLLEKHHKSLNNFKVVGSSLEASSKVYSLRVDSIHNDVVRMCSGLSKKNFTAAEDAELEKDKEQREGGENEENANENNAEGGEAQAKQKKKRQKKQVSTVTKNKETLNAPLETNPFVDPLFAQLNTMSGNYNSSDRLLQNILPTQDSVMKLSMDTPFWDSKEREPIKFAEPWEYDYSQFKLFDAPWVNTLSLDGLVIRPQYTGYRITDTPADEDESDENRRLRTPEKDLSSDMAVAFDMNAEIEPTQPESEVFMDVDMGQLDDLTEEDQIAINNCKTLRRQAVTLEDLRPIDASSSTLEYSYRPLDKISQFWAGPSHWKFKKSRSKSMSIGQQTSSLHEQTEKQQKQRGRKKVAYRTQNVPFGQIHDELFQKLDTKMKFRRANIQKSWDYRKLKLPTDLQIDKNIFDVYKYAPGVKVNYEVDPTISQDMPIEASYDYNNPPEIDYCATQQDDHFADAEPIPPVGESQDVPNTQEEEEGVVEIAAHFEGAPEMVTKIVVPFARRAKVIDMKQLKTRCLEGIQEELDHTVDKELPPPPPCLKYDKYKPGEASFMGIYKKLPQILTPKMADALSPAIAFYAILHLANEKSLRLVAQEDLEDFKIRKLETD